MPTGFYNAETELAFAPEASREIRVVEAVPAPQPGGGGDLSSDYPRLYGTPALNSRISVSLPDGIWRVDWTADLYSGLQPGFVLQAADRLLVGGAFQWQLFGLAGKHLRVDARGAGEVILDGASGRFYMAEPSGLIGARRLSDGGRAFAFTAFAGERFGRERLACRDDRILVVSVEQAMMSRGGRMSSLSAVETIDLGAAREVDAFGVLTSARVEAQLVRDTAHLLSALSGDTLVLATADSIFVADWDLRLHAELHGEFFPLAMSLDETGRIYLIVRVPKGGTGESGAALWVLGNGGERLAEVVLPGGPRAYTPPIVGYDGTIYLLLGHTILALDPNGAERWEVNAGAPIAGAVVLKDGHLLITAGPYIFAFDEQGERKLIFHLEGENWTTPAILTPDGQMLAASERHLYSLKAAQ